MLRIIKADMYRLVRGKGIYIVFALVTIMLILEAAGNVGTIGVNVSITENENVDAGELLSGKLTGKEAVFHTIGTSDNLVYFLLAILIMIAAIDFSDGNIKNVLSGGVSRRRFYFAKWMLSVLFTIFAMILNIIIPIATATVINGFGGKIDSAFIQDLLLGTGIQLLLIIGIVSFGIFLVFVTRKSSAVIGGYIAFCILPMVIILILTEINTKFESLYKYDIISNIRMVSNPSALESGDIVRAAMIGIACTVLPLVFGLGIFKKCEIK